MAFYTPPVEQDSFNDAVMTVVPVIASFNTNGTIKPLYVRIKGISLAIIGCWCQPVMGILKYYCTVNDQGYSKQIILTYHPDHSFWTIEI